MPITRAVITWGKRKTIAQTQMDEIDEELKKEKSQK